MATRLKYSICHTYMLVRITSNHDKRKWTWHCFQNFPDKTQLPWAAYIPLFYEANLLSSWPCSVILPVGFLGRKRVARTASSQGRWESPLSDGLSRPADDFNRVILPMKRGQEYTDYINASFIDVSARLSCARAGVPPPDAVHG